MLEIQLRDIQNDITELKAAVSLLVSQNGSANSVCDLNEYIPIKEIIDKYCSKPTFYKHVHDGLIKLYKFGRLSFVKRSEFEQAFHKISLGEGGPAKYSC